jgi:CMP-N,N'-diacetyllegionaminic acid synthase
MSERGATLAVVPARGGSRGLPNKLLRRLGGVPLIVHTIRAAAGAHSLDDVLVSTDDPRIRRVARAHGANAPFVRPAELSTDEASTPPVIRHAVEWYEAETGRPVAVAVTLQPTSPLRSAEEIDAAVAMLEETTSDSVVSVADLGVPVSVIGQAQEGRWRSLAPTGTAARRQEAPPAMRLTGGIYVTRRELVAQSALVGGRVAALVVGEDSAIDIDDADDLRAARRAWSRRRR